MDDNDSNPSEAYWLDRLRDLNDEREELQKDAREVDELLSNQETICNNLSREHFKVRGKANDAAAEVGLDHCRYSN